MISYEEIVINFQNRIHFILFHRDIPTIAASTLWNDPKSLDQGLLTQQSYLLLKKHPIENISQPLYILIYDNRIISNHFTD